MHTYPLISLRNASVALDGAPILRDLHWDLVRGAHTAVIGANGSGKSTFSRLIAGQIWPRNSRSRWYGFGEKPTHTPLLARERIAQLSPETQEKYVRQSLVGAEGERGWQLSVRQTIATGWFDSWLLHQIPDTAQWVRVEELLAQFDLETLAAREISTLSQGQLRRVLLARALVKNPEVLILDEACSGLDSASRAALLDHLQNLAQRGQTTLVMTTHRPDELVPAIREIWEMKAGTLTKSERCFHARSTSNSTQTPLKVSASPTDSVPLLELRNASVTLEGKTILPLLNWRWMPGEHWAIEGENGSGKSTFLRLLRGHLSPAWGGEIVRFGHTRRRSVEAIGRDMALFSPQIQARFSDVMPIEDAIGSGFLDAFALWRDLTLDERARVETIMERLELDDLRGRELGKLSYGQTRRVLLARALVTEPKIVLLDEALDGLDSQTRAHTGELLGELAREDVHFAFASHHAEDFPAFVTHHLRFPLRG